MRKTIIVLTAVFLALVSGLFFYLAFQGAGNRRNAVQHLSSGASILLASVDYTNGTHTFNGGTMRQASSVLGRLIPQAILARLGLGGGTGSMSIGGRGMGTNLCAWTYFEMSGPGVSQNLRVMISDGLGNKSQIGYAMGVMSSGNGISGYCVEGFAAPGFPRRGRTLTFSFYEQVKGKWQQAADFTVPNPAMGSYPQWTAESLPAARTNEDLTVSLEAFQSGLSSSRPQEFRPAASNELGATRAVLKITQTGRETNSWRPKTVEISDATGNQWIQWVQGVRLWHSETNDEMVFDDLLWPGENAWKVKVELSQVGDFAPEEVCTFTNVPLPEAGQVISLSDRLMIGKTELKLGNISGISAEQPGNLKWGTVKGEINVSVGVAPVTRKGDRLTMVSVTDDSGEYLKVHPDIGYDGAPEQLFAFKPPKDAKAVNITFALHKSRYVEFLARPEFPTNAVESGKN
jgi:hypothetical protein